MPRPRKPAAARPVDLALAIRRKQAEKAAMAERYRPDPAAYARDVLGVTLTPDQEAILHSLTTHRRTAVKASHAIGKTFTAAIACCHWYDCWDAHIAYVTAPTWYQALGLTFKQLKLLRRRRGLPGIIQETGRLIDPDARRSPVHFVKAINAETGEGFQGEHSAPILIVIEEGPGVKSHIWQATDGLMTHPDNAILALGNPTDEGTPFGEACNDPGWNVLTISALGHPNIAAEMECRPPPLPDAVRLLWLKEMLEKECLVVPADQADADCFEFWSAPTIDAALDGLPAPANPAAERWTYKPGPVFQGRVLGEFPSLAEQKVIPRAWLRDLPRRESSGVPEIGCDSARFGGDRTVIAVRRGPCLLSVKEIRRLDQGEVCGALRIVAAEAARAAGNLDPTAIPMRIDVTGGLGTGPADILKAEGYRVSAVNSSERANDDSQYPNRRSELWFTVREMARKREIDISRLSPDQQKMLCREWSTPNWKPDAKGRKVVEPKQETRGRLGYSPDLADGVNLAFYGPGRVSQGAPRAWGALPQPHPLPGLT